MYIDKVNLYLSLIGIILRWGFLIWELIFIYCGLFVLILVVFVLFLLSICLQKRSICLQKNKKELETQIQTIRICSQNIEMEFSIENVPC